MPLPMTPTLLTVLTKVCADESRMLPDTSRTLLSLEEDMSVHLHREFSRDRGAVGNNLVGTHIAADEMFGSHPVGYKHFSAALPLLFLLDPGVGVVPVVGVDPLLVQCDQAGGARQELGAPDAALPSDSTTPGMSRTADDHATPQIVDRMLPRRYIMALRASKYRLT